MPILLVFLRNTYKFQLKQKQNKKSVHSYSIFQLISAKPMARSLYVLPLPSLILMTTAVYYFSLLQIAVSRHGISTWKTGKKNFCCLFLCNGGPSNAAGDNRYNLCFFLKCMWLWLMLETNIP